MSVDFIRQAKEIECPRCKTNTMKYVKHDPDFYVYIACLSCSLETGYQVGTLIRVEPKIKEIAQLSEQES